MGDMEPLPIRWLIERAGRLSIEDADDLYRAYASRLLIDGSGRLRAALADARRSAARDGKLELYERARREAVAAWRGALPPSGGPWLMVGSAVANAAGALVLGELLDDRTFQMLVGPWRQAIGTLAPVGPGLAAPVGRTPAQVR